MTRDLLFAALADPSRRAIVEALRAGPAPVGVLAAGLPISRPAVSQHLKVLSDAGLLECSPKGNRRLYRLSRQGIADLRAYADALWEDALAAFAAHAETLSQEPPMSTDPVVKTLTVPLPPERAFEAFTQDLDTWWPLDSHSLSAADGQLPQRVEVKQTGVYETLHDGRREPWGSVTAWDPGARFAMKWHVGRPEEDSTFLDVRFEAQGSGTRITLIHDGWDVLGSQGAQMRAGYHTGWDHVLGTCFGALCAKRAASALIR